MRLRITPVLTALALALPFSIAQAEEKVLNLYSARHYQTDEQLYSDFTKQTGIKINRIEADDNALFERLKNEGRNSPADVILMVDAARIWRAEIEGFFQPVQSKILDSRIPANLRGKDDGKGSEWFGFSKRARVIVYNKAQVKPEDVATYESLADPKNKGKVCTRSGSHPYNLALIGSMIERNGPQATEEWAKGMVTNFARPPRGGDTDQIKGVASGECGVAIANSYYYARLLRSTKPEDVAMMKNVGFIWPNAKTTGTHFNIAGAGVAKNAPHRENAVKFLEYLASDSAQFYFSEGNNEWPIVANIATKNEALDSLGKYKIENISIASIAKNQIAAQRILDRVGYK
ncbi:MAG: Fe(3+) ABC transporter substrate-binding protein [Oxalicibacterium faecigallinarum]|uniref:Iron deficiency-induced protein A n=1 Tax=Oxalicibacterium faecigallinarum TaxID=573741 RepID=A0A8J3ALQ0_9BURK|nr:Fe(3+) ABC transporter substrate-binding protein [Oxalicibacterium faecigallinarum]MDQ7969836.1 Fe(3+) ABC transporter substrate-binding protein [Oxalicibacterium faecigallinarum]GGI15998.1 iron deficiency-induced protein A [Oxalicibacterium faecigallinarum]